MKKIFLVFLLFLFPSYCYAITDTARSTIVMDMDSGRVLYEKNADEQRLVASISKIMTAVIAIENGNLDDIVEVGEEVLSMYGSNIYIELGEKITLRDLLYGLLLRSGNDAAVVIGTHIAGSEEKFVKLMNDKAKFLGMKNTLYKNCHGLDENTQNYSSARDMAILSSYANTMEVYRKISGTKKWSTKTNKKSYLWNNRNKLLYSYSNTTGGKTGYTPSAGRTLVTTASKNNLNLTIVTLKDANEYITHESLYEYVFNKYKKYQIIDKENFTIDKKISNYECYIKESFSYPLKDSEKDKVRIIVKLYKLSDFKNNDVVGNIKVLLDENEIFKENIYGKVNKKRNNFIMDLIKKISSFFRNLKL